MILTNNPNEITTLILKKWLSEKMDVSKVEEKLRTTGLDDEHISSYLKEFKKLVIAQRQYKGFIWMAAGAILGFISCLLTILNPVPSLYYHILYGFTSVAIVVIFVGLYLVFE